MPLLKSHLEIFKFVPPLSREINTGTYTHAPSKVVNFFPLYAIYVNKNDVAERTFKVRMECFRTMATVYLMLTNVDNAKNQNRLFVSKSVTEVLRNPENRWGFKADGIGLYIDVSSKCGGKVYFGTSFLDIAEVRTKLIRKEHKKTVTTEVVYV